MRPERSSFLNLSRLTLAFALFSALSVTTFARPLSVTEQRDALATVHAFTQAGTEAEYKVFIEKLFTAFKRNCDASVKDSNVPCLVRECDLQSASTCRPDHILYFRGEDFRPPWPSTSALVRAHWNGSNFARLNSTTDLFTQLAGAINLIRPHENPDQGDNLLFIRAPGVPRWIFYEDGKTNRQENLAEPEKPYELQNPADALSLINLLFSFHSQNDELFYRDPKLGRISLDPFVSYTQNPLQALRFAKKGRLLIASMGPADFDKNCGETPPQLGKVFDPSGCPQRSLFENESEVDAFLYLSPKFVWKSFYTPLDPWPKSETYHNYL